MRTLAIDLGQRRVGLALSDEGGRFATPLEVLFVSSAEAATEPILAILCREGVQRVVLGLPLNMDGTAGPIAQQTFAWGKALAGQSGLPVVFVDERLSSFDAEQTLVARKRAGEKLTRQRKKERLDAVAAASFLQAFLDGKLAPLTPPESIHGSFL
ncbi:MAG TPA: Holliday junction resolvase RuvX [Tepidisphaeraceae bacterium]|nr:Holliday junction resolvase RuvX [Tepidisphaeraceae bacterium]